MIDHDEMQIPITSAYNTEDEDELKQTIPAENTHLQYYHPPQGLGFNTTLGESTLSSDGSRTHDLSTSTPGTSSLVGAKTIPHYRWVLIYFEILQVGLSE